MESLANYLRVKAFSFGEKSPEDILARAMIRILIDKARSQRLNPHEVLERMRLRLKAAAEVDPNDDPMDLFRQIMPTLRLMKINNMADRGKTQLSEGTNKKGERLYQILLRRDSTLTPTEIDGIHRQRDAFNGLTWTNKGMVAEVWGTYTSPAPTGPK